MANVKRNKRKNTLTGPQLDLQPVKPKTDNQAKFFERYDSGKSQLVTGYPGTGKAQPLYSSILTPAGWVKMEDISIGDLVRSIDGWTTVTGVFPQGQKQVVRLHFKDGGYADCCEEHLWTVHNNINSKGNKGPSKKKTITTYDIMELLDSKAKSASAEYANISIDCIAPIEMEEKPFIVSPYIMGVLLGDGNLTTSSVNITSVDPEILDRVSKELPKGVKLCNRKKSITFGFVDEDCTWKVPNRLTAALKEMGLAGKKSEFKFIPTNYLEGSIAQRYSLLQGLMDTDGTVDKRTGAISYSTSSKALCEDVRALVLSLGGKASVSKKVPYYTDAVGNRKKGLTAYIISILLEDKAKCFHLGRKKKYTYLTDKSQLRRVMSHYELLDYTEMQCISVEHTSSLYVTDDYLLTHNTFLAKYKAFEDVIDTQSNFNKIIIVRSSVPTRDIGFLPGSLAEKNEVYELPYKSICTELFNRGDAYGILKKHGILEFVTTSFIRGITVDRAIIIVDELQNMSTHEASSIITRVGIDCKIIFCGDLLQTDFTKDRDKDIGNFIKILQNMPNEFSVTSFTAEDIVRSNLVKQFILTQANLGLI